MRYTGKHLVRVGIGVLHNVGGEDRNGTGKRLRLSSFELRRPGKEAIHQVGTGGKHTLVKVWCNVPDTLCNNRQGCLDNRA